MSTKIQIHTLSQRKVVEKIQWLNSCGRLQQKRRKWLSLWRSLDCFGKYNLIQGNSKVQLQGGWLINIQESMWTVANIFVDHKSCKKCQWVSAVEISEARMTKFCEYSF